MEKRICVTACWAICIRQQLKVQLSVVWATHQSSECILFAVHLSRTLQQMAKVILSGHELGTSHRAITEPLACPSMFQSVTHFMQHCKVLSHLCEPFANGLVVRPNLIVCRQPQLNLDGSQHRKHRATPATSQPWTAKAMAAPSSSPTTWALALVRHTDPQISAIDCSACSTEAALLSIVLTRHKQAAFQQTDHTLGSFEVLPKY